MVDLYRNNITLVQGDTFQIRFEIPGFIHTSGDIATFIVCGEEGKLFSKQTNEFEKDGSFIFEFNKNDTNELIPGNHQYSIYMSRGNGDFETLLYNKEFNLKKRCYICKN